jgi:predicted transcriptional regulator
MTGTRNQIARQVRRNPGIHFNELIRTLDLAPGQVQYHLRKLERSHDVVEESLYGRTHYYTPDYGTWERGALAVLRRETARDVLVYLMANGSSTPNAVADGVNIARSTLEWHLNHLVEQDLVEKQRDPRNHVTLVITHPEETARMLRLVEPSIADRLVDRFTRLIDGLLATEQGTNGDKESET